MILKLLYFFSKRISNQIYRRGPPVNKCWFSCRFHFIGTSHEIYVGLQTRALVPCLKMLCRSTFDLIIKRNSKMKVFKDANLVFCCTVGTLKQRHEHLILL